MKSLSEIGLPHLPLHFDIFFDSLLLKCNSNSFGGFTRGSLKRIYPSDVAWLSEPERTAAWLTAARLSLVVASYLSMTISGSWRLRFLFSCPEFDGLEKELLIDGMYSRNFLI